MLMGGGAKSAKLTLGGPKVVGTVVEEPTEVQMRDYDTDELLWLDPPPGSPADAPKTARMQIRTLIQTDLREDDEDDGIRALFLKGQLRVATRDACRAAGSPQGLEIGGRIEVQVTGAEPVTNKAGKRMNDKKIHTVTYSKPPVRSNLDGSSGGDAVSSPPPTARPAAAPAAAPAGDREVVIIDGVETDITDYPEPAKVLARTASGGEASPDVPPF
jgi:hypothetical protein